MYVSIHHQALSHIDPALLNTVLKQVSSKALEVWKSHGDAESVRFVLPISANEYRFFSVSKHHLRNDVLIVKH